MSSEQPINFEEMRQVWRSQHNLEQASSPPGADWDEKELLMDVKKRAQKLDRVIVWRDRQEILTAIVVSIAMGSASVMAPGWLPKAGALVLIACCIYVCAHLIRARRHSPGAHGPMPLADGLRAEIARVDRQTELLRTVRDWYVLPLAIGGTVWVVTLIPIFQMPAGKALAMVAVAATVSTLIFTLIGAGVVALNKWAIREQFDPYRRELEGLLAEVKA